MEVKDLEKRFQLARTFFFSSTFLLYPQELTARDAVCKQVFRKVK